MTDERNPSNDVRAWSPLVETFRAALMAEHSDDWDMNTVAEAAYICAAALTAAGFVVLRAPGLNHGDVLEPTSGTVHGEPFLWRRPVPEPAPECDTCGGSGTADWGLGTCSTCGGSGVATTEGDKQ